MKTEISQFCDEYAQALQGLPERLADAVEALGNGAGESVTRAPTAALDDIRARLKSLVGKLENQQAYLLIFGPLKSGKSTLMNAISCDYVSEVTSLPGYPCLVYVGHSDERHFSVTRYNGRESVFSEAKVLHDIVEDSHIVLADQIRAAEERGETFEPSTHFSEAIRRVDVKFPIENLRESSTILVDTPGLYSRMNFGYDLLTREFRDSAACAVFVVKTDNLFLEQVFTEFNELLGLFSRIFLVVNVDSNKRDLKPDGTLAPSAESEHPEEIVKAFKTLSMAAPLLEAYGDGRLRIHSVDLLSAASSYLRRKSGAADRGADGGERQVEAFEGFLKDLTEYLNSSDYTTAFMRDSLRQGETLCVEAAAVATGAEALALRERQEELEAQIGHVDARLEALDRLISTDWSATFDAMRTHHAQRAEELASSKAAEVAKSLDEALDTWFESPESLKSLERNHWNPILVSAGRDLAEGSQSRIRSSISNALGGAEPTTEALADLNLVGFALTPSRNAASEQLTLEFDEDLHRIALKSEEIPVRKSFVDYLLFRRKATVRDRLLGPPDSLDLEIPPERKQARLTGPGRAAFSEIVARVTGGEFPNRPRKDAEQLVARYSEAFCRDVDDRLRTRLTEVMDERQELTRPFAANRRILASLDALHQETAAKGNAIRSLEARIAGGTEVAVLPTPEERTVAPSEPVGTDENPSAASGVVSN